MVCTLCPSKEVMMDFAVIPALSAARPEPTFAIYTPRGILYCSEISLVTSTPEIPRYPLSFSSIFVFVDWFIRPSIISLALEMGIA